MTTGEGGACVTSDPALWERLQDLRAHGMVDMVVPRGELRGALSLVLGYLSPAKAA